MKTKRIKTILATAMTITTATTVLNVPEMAIADTVGESKSFYYSENASDVCSEVSNNAIYENDFESNQLADEIDKVTTTSAVSISDGNSAMMFESHFDGTGDWSNNMHGFSFNVDYNENLPSGSTIQFDLLIPTANKQFSGIIKCTGALKDSSWGWNGASVKDVGSNDFMDLGNGYSLKKVSIEVGSNVNGVKQVIAQITGYNCDYSGDMYMDNLRLISNEVTNNSDISSVSPIQWNFDSDANGWSYGGQWAYNGPIDSVINYDASTTGSGALKLSLDYSKDSGASWSEFKISKDLGAATSFNGYNVLTYDFIYNPSEMTTGKFQTKFSAGDSLSATGEIDLNNLENVGNGLKKAQVKIQFVPQNIEATSVTLGIVGSNTDYKGDIYIDNVKFDQEKVVDGYVEKTATTEAQVKVEPYDLENMPSNVKLVDSQANSKTAGLFSYLKGIGKSNYVLYGHQNDTHNKAFLRDSLSNSDTKDVTGSIAAICGIDASFTASEVHYTDEDKQNGLDVITKGANLAIDIAKQGGIITVSAHMPNFELVKKKGKDADGKYDYSEYSSDVTTGNIVPRIMPGGDLNEVYIGYLDRLSEFAHKLDGAGVPVLFRPFHENNGSWFWWGKAYCDEESYKNLYRYTVQYLRDNKNVHNFLYVYSPGATFVDDNDYLSRYPGDEFVDGLGFDMYDTNPTEDYKTDPWMNSFKGTVDLVSKLASGRGKFSAVAEVGISSMPVSGNVDKEWFSHVADIVSASDMAYYMTWSNYDTNSFFAPFMVSETRGQEMINDFINYYNKEESVFADGVGDYSGANLTVDSAYSYGFITEPTSSSRILKPTTITASVKGYNGQIQFALKNKEGNVLETLNATKDENGAYSADITQAALDKIGQTVGSIELYSNDTKLNGIKAIFNIEEAKKDPKVVDDFETYSGDDVLLQQTWATNYGADCNIKPTLDVNNKYKGECGLAFNYKITAGQYAGITKSLDVDWSGCDALQIWVKPDGKGQKLVIQLTSNGEDFEVWMPEFAATTEAKLLTIPFSDFKGKNNGTFDPAHISKMGLWCNTIGSETVDSTMCFDDIKAINIKVVENSSENSNTDVNLSNGSNSSNSSSSSSNRNSGSSEVNNNNNVQHIILTKNSWIQENGTWKYVDEKGEKVSNTWKQIDGKWYYFNEDSTMKTGWFKYVNNNWYYLESSGAMRTDWIKDVDGNWYYLQGNGAMKIGWLLDKDNNWYYLQSNGAMKTGWFQDVDGKWYFLKPNGAMARNEQIDGYWVDESGAWV